MKSSSKAQQRRDVIYLKRAILVAEAETKRPTAGPLDGASKPPIAYDGLLTRLRQNLVREQAVLDKLV